VQACHTVVVIAFNLNTSEKPSGDIIIS